MLGEEKARKSLKRKPNYARETMKACMYFCCSLYMKCNKLLATLRIIIQLIHYFYACQLSVWYHALGALSPPQKRGNAEIKLDYSIREREAGIGATKEKNTA